MAKMSLECTSKWVLAVLLLAVSNATQSLAREASITIQTPNKTITFKRSELMAMADPMSLSVNDDATYKGKPISYTVVPAFKLFKDLGIKLDSTILFKCLDGFSAPISTKQLLNQSESEALAYVAIEDPKHPWPKLKSNSSATAGPFYLIWKNASLSKVGTEQWPFQLAAFVVKPSLQEAFPQIFPEPSASTAVQKGLKVFTKNCFACHTLNLAGDSKMGPDLNIPHNPTEYFKDEFLRTLIRNPQSLRHWPESKMSRFSEELLSNSDLSDLVAYLKYMSGRKVSK